MNNISDGNPMYFHNCTDIPSEFILDCNDLRKRSHICPGISNLLCLQNKTRKPGYAGLKFQSPYPHINFHYFNFFKNLKQSKDLKQSKTI